MSSFEMLEPMTRDRPLKSIGLLLVENFCLIAFAAVTEPLRLANQLAGRTLYSWQTLTLSGRSVKASNGIEVTPGGAALDGIPLDLLLLCGGGGGQYKVDPECLRWLQSQASRGVHLGALEAGNWILAEAGLLDGYDCSVVWEDRAKFQAAFPAVCSSEEFFVLDRHRYTAAGGIAGMQMMLKLMSRAHGTQLVAAISESLGYAGISSAPTAQQLTPRQALARLQPHLHEVLTLMENNIEEPLDLDFLATFIGLSRRQLERLFREHLRCSPSRHYLKLRLIHARYLLNETAEPIIEVASRCGFLSTPNFTKRYREYFGIVPSGDRLQKPLLRIEALH